jgi:hypothetical protein
MSCILTNGHTECRALSNVPGGCEWFDGHKKCVGEVSLHFQLELHALGEGGGGFSVPTDKTLKNRGQNNVGR